MLFSGVPSACFMAIVAVLNSDNAVLSELTEVSRQIHSAGSRLAEWQASWATRPIGVVPEDPACPYCGEGACRVCRDTACTYDESCGEEGNIQAPKSSAGETLVSAARHAIAAVRAVADRVEMAVRDALANRVAVADEIEGRMGCDFLPGCDFGWTSQPDTAPAAEVAPLVPRAPEPPAEEESVVLTPAPVAPAIASQAAADPFDGLFGSEPAVVEPRSSLRPVLYAAAALLDRVAQAADAASERLYYLAGDEAPQDGE